MFAIEHEFLCVEPPDYLRQVNPRLYEQECDRIRQRFDEAVQLAEEAFASELHKLLAHLVERLSGEVDGKPKVFRDTAVSNLTEFFRRFRQLNIRSNADLDTLVDQTQQAVEGVKPQTLRESQPFRSSVATELSRVRDLLDDFLVDRPRRNILRRPH